MFDDLRTVSPNHQRQGSLMSLWLCAALLLSSGAAAAQPAPHGLLCDLLPRSSKAAPIRDRQPEFTWIVPKLDAARRQAAYRVQVAAIDNQPAGSDGSGAASHAAKLANDPVWDSGWVKSSKSVAVEYGGPALKPEARYAWRVRVRLQGGQRSKWSAPQTIVMADQSKIAGPYTVSQLPLATEHVKPKRLKQTGDRRWFVDFGRAAFGTVKLHVPEPKAGTTLELHLGEKLAKPTRVDRNPGGTIRHQKVTLTLKADVTDYTIQLPPFDLPRQSAIEMPDRLPPVMPFRYVELHGLKDVKKAHLRQMRVHYPFEDDAASFSSSDDVLDQVWELCHYSIKATSFTGVYVDGDRERTPYEADAYINQLSHYGVDRAYSMARYTHEYMLRHPTWPTEWIMHSVLMAWQDYQYTGDLDSVRRHYETLKAKTLMGLARKNGLITTRQGQPKAVLEAIHRNGKLRDIVDWPKGERDGYKLTDYNTVVNAFHVRTLGIMAELAQATGHPQDATMFEKRRNKVLAAFQDAFFDQERGLYTDGLNTDHVSLHANMFPLALGLVPEEHQQSVVQFVKKQGMACSVYGAQYLVRSLYQQREAQAALELMRSKQTRSWWNMIRVGSTITLEAWDRKFKNNLDWNHAWGAAPANLIPRFLLGVRPLEAGFGRVLVAPQPASLRSASGRVPTIRGPVVVDFQRMDGGYRLKVQLPPNAPGRIVLPQTRRATRITHNQQRVELADESAEPVTIDAVPPGKHVFRVRLDADQRP